MNKAESVQQQLERVTAEFRKQFGRPPRYAAVAPGRVNLIGEHTDYNDGFVLPMAIERQTLMVADRASGRQARVASTGAPGIASFSVDADLSRGEPAWANYVKGVVVGCLAAGLDPEGFDALVDSTVPTGGGLSSSAALEVATATLIEAMTGRKLDPVRKALLCQTAEHEYALMPCGIMDQFISAMGRQGHAMLLDCRSHQTRMVPLVDPGVTVLITNSHVKHELVSGEYAQRRAQCAAAAKALGLTMLRDASLSQLEARQSQMDDLAYRRARHVISENDRTTHAADAAAKQDWNQFGQLMLASHASLRDDFEVSCQELDILVELAQRKLGTGVYGSRMTGGGFGGCTVSLVRSDAADAVGDYLRQEYKARTGIEATIFSTRPAQGARILDASRG